MRRPCSRRFAHSRAQAGYTLLVLAVAVTVLNVLLALALPAWSRAIQREKEEELIARGLQYAEAIRVFRNRFGRLPLRLEELIEVKPRSIRRLWKDPMTDGGEWDLILEGVPARPGQGGRPPGGRPPGTPPRTPPPGEVPGEGGLDPDGRPLVALGGEGQVTIGPIAGVRSKSREESIKLFFGRQTHREWQFTYLVFQNAAGFGVPGTAHPLAFPTRAQWIGRPFPPDLVPPEAGAPASLPEPGAPPPGARPPGRPSSGGRPARPGDAE